ncbi:metacaspase [Kwoniella mangroviensis CBS 10435]|uniref:Metacaspase n=1 Tax=Kwoniella mangroviensis CBS 10435 TaxID=1331196 RepID=A0A1B9IHB1_9TREE|nr:metacaspase [Kwoniella mangroviensis CBS 10435]
MSSDDEYEESYEEEREEERSEASESEQPSSSSSSSDTASNDDQGSSHSGSESGSASGSGEEEYREAYENEGSAGGVTAGGYGYGGGGSHGSHSESGDKEKKEKIVKGVSSIFKKLKETREKDKNKEENDERSAGQHYTPGGEYQATGVEGSFGAMNLNEPGQGVYPYRGAEHHGGYDQQPQQYVYGAPQQQFGGYDQNYNQGFPGAEYRQGADQYSHVPPPGPPPESYYPTGAGYVPQHEYQATQPPYGNQYKGPDDGQPHHQHYGPTFTDPQTGEVAQAFFEYSRCNGTRKALLIGINYFGTAGELAGCINDAHNVQRFICERFGYIPADIVMLTDDTNDPRTLPTRENIIKGMRWLVEGAQRDDALFLHYSGHGTQTEDLDGDEGDDDDEAICPLDYETAGLIIDEDTNHELVVKPLPAGCRLTAIFDSCHSGTVMDLPYVYSTEGTIKEPDLLSEAKEGLLGAGMDILRGDTGGIMANLFGAAKDVFDAKKSHEKTKKTRTSPADVIQWAGCKDNQTSADTQEEGKATGAMSYAFIAALTKYPNQSYQQLLTSIREEMKGRYTQKPQLSACHRESFIKAIRRYF